MTEGDRRRALAESIVQTLDAMFFTSCLGEPEARVAPRFELAAQVAFDGRPPGRLTLRVDQAAARSIAAGFLGEEEDAISERQVSDVVCEMANVICGAALSRIEGAEEFRLGAPRMVEPAAADARRGGVAHAVETGRGVLEAALEMEELVCPPAEKSAS